MTKDKGTNNTVVSKPKKTTQGQGKHSKPKNGKKLHRGQGK
jgi:hypothetical protein